MPIASSMYHLVGQLMYGPLAFRCFVASRQTHAVKGERTAAKKVARNMLPIVNAAGHISAEVCRDARSRKASAFVHEMKERGVSSE